MNEEDIKQLLPVMLKLGVISDGAPKAGYEIELALSYFKNLSVTKRYHLPLLNKLPTEPPVSTSLLSCINYISKRLWCYRYCIPY